MPMNMFGNATSTKVEIWALTQYGSQKAATNAPVPGDPVSKRVFRTLVSLGGQAEMDELISQSQVDNQTIRVSLQKLADKGLVQPVMQNVPQLGA